MTGRTPCRHAISGRSGREPCEHSNVRITHDAEADAAYVYLVDEINRGEVAYSRFARIKLEHAELTVDFDANGRILGIEVLGAGGVLRQETISAAEDTTRRE